MSKKKRKPICRKDFILEGVRSGLTYPQAKAAYAATMRIIERAVLSCAKINFGNVLSITPVERPPREVHKHFQQGPGGVVKKGTKEVYYLGRRFSFRVNVYKKFLDTHELDWL